MNAYLLHYAELTNADPSIATWAGNFGLRPIYINRGLITGKSKSVMVFDTLDDAIAEPRLSGMTWVWLDADGDVYLDEFEHPKNRVVYCIGSDYNGFDGRDVSELPGTHVRLRQKQEMYSVMVAAMLCYDRAVYLEGRRR